MLHDSVLYKFTTDIGIGMRARFCMRQVAWMKWNEIFKLAENCLTAAAASLAIRSSYVGGVHMTGTWGVKFPFTIGAAKKQLDNQHMGRQIYSSTSTIVTAAMS